MEAYDIIETQHMDNDQLQNQLLELIEAEKAAFKKRLDAFYAGNNHSVESYSEVNDELIESLERIFKIYKDNNGDESLFLTNALRPLRKAYDRAIEYKQQVEQGYVQKNEEFTGFVVPDDRQVVHVTLYMAGGHELSRWEQQLSSLNKLVQTRPVYETEEMAQKATRGQMTMNTEAYVSVAVKKNAIIRSGAAASRQDRQGRPVLTLTEQAIDDAQYIVQFVLAGKYYRYVNGKLVHTIPGKSGLFR